MPTEDRAKDLRSVVLAALWGAADCPDSTEVHRACRSCEAVAVVEALLSIDFSQVHDPR